MIFQTKSVGIDVRPDSVRIAVTALKSGHIKVLNLIGEDIPEVPEHERTALTASIIKRIFNEHGLKGEVCVTCLPASQSINRTVTIPLTDDAKIRQTLKFQIEPQIPYPIEQVISDGMVIRKLDDGTEMLAIAVTKELISAELQALEMADVSPQILTLDALTLADFYINPLDFTPDRVTALLLVNSENTFLGFFVGERLIGYRNLDGMAQNGEGAAEKLARELQRSIVGFQPSMGGLNEVGVLCVAGQRTGLLHKVLQQTFREFPVRMVEYNEKTLVEIPPDFLDAADNYGLAIALAYSGLQTSANAINLRQEEFAPPSLISQVKPSIVFSTAVLVIMALAWFGHARAQIYYRSKHLKVLNEEMLQIFADTLPGTRSPSVAEDKIKEEQEKFKSLRNYSSEYVSPLEVLAELAGSIPPGTNLVLSELYISENVARLRGTVDSFDDIDIFKNKVENSPLLSSVKIESAAKAERGEKVSFRIRAQIGREANPNANSQAGSDS